MMAKIYSDNLLHYIHYNMFGIQWKIINLMSQRAQGIDFIYSAPADRHI